MLGGGRGGETNIIRKNKKTNIKSTRDNLFEFKSELENKIDGSAKMLKDELHQGFDKIFKELETIREDRVFAIAKDREQDHRLDKLELTIGISKA